MTLLDFTTDGTADEIRNFAFSIPWRIGRPTRLPISIIHFDDI